MPWWRRTYAWLVKDVKRQRAVLPRTPFGDAWYKHAPTTVAERIKREIFRITKRW